MNDSDRVSDWDIVVVWDCDRVVLELRDASVEDVDDAVTLPVNDLLEDREAETVVVAVNEVLDVWDCDTEIDLVSLNEAVADELTEGVTETLTLSEEVGDNVTDCDCDADPDTLVEFVELLDFEHDNEVEIEMLADVD